MTITRIVEILKDIRATGSTNEKMRILESVQDDLFKTVLRLTYDGGYVYHVRSSQLDCSGGLDIGDCTDTFKSALEHLTKIAYDGLDAKKDKAALSGYFKFLSPDARDVLAGVINHDLKLGLNVTSLNKVYGNGFIPVMQYMRCGQFTKSSAKNISFPAFLQVKMDGTYREICVSDGLVQIRSRNGKLDKNPILEEYFKDKPEGRYTGELTITGSDRAKGNGKINSKNPEYENIVFTVWDYIRFDDSLPYKDRFEELQKIIKNNDNVQVIKTVIVNDLNDIKQCINEWYAQGEEGGVLKDFRNVWKSGTSKTQLKIKKILDADVRITGFTEGTYGSKRHGKIGAICFSTDDGKVQGKVSGFRDEVLEDCTANPDNYIGKIMTIRFNDVCETDAAHCTLFLPRFVMFRDDKDETDTLERIVEMTKTAVI